MSRALSLPQVVQEIGAELVSVDQLTQWLKAGRIPGRKIGRKWAMTSEDIAEFLEMAYRPARATRPEVVSDFALSSRSRRSA